MSLDAFVPCTCVSQGLVSHCPIDPALLSFEDGIVQLRPPTNTTSHTNYKALQWALEQWLRDCCAHPNQVHTQVRIGSWSTVQLLKEYLNNKALGDFPVLRTILPPSNTRIIQPEIAKVALAELEVFSKKDTDVLGCSLINEQNGEEFSFSTHGAVVAYKNGIEIRYDCDGITVRKRSKVLLSSRRVQQRMSFGVATLVGENGSEFFGLGVGNKPANWSVTERPLAGEDFRCVAPLRQVFQVSMNTGMPIHLLC